MKRERLRKAIAGILAFIIGFSILVIAIAPIVIYMNSSSSQSAQIINSLRNVQNLKLQEAMDLVYNGTAFVLNNTGTIPVTIVLAGIDPTGNCNQNVQVLKVYNVLSPGGSLASITDNQGNTYSLGQVCFLATSRGNVFAVKQKLSSLQSLFSSRSKQFFQMTYDELAQIFAGTNPDLIALHISNNELQPDFVAGIFNSSYIPVSYIVSVLNSPYLDPAKAGAIIVSNNLNPAKAYSVLSDPSFTADKIQQMLYNAPLTANFIAILTYGAQDLIISSNQTMSGILRCNNHTIYPVVSQCTSWRCDLTTLDCYCTGYSYSGGMLYLDGQPGVIIANTVNIQGWLIKTPTGAPGGTSGGGRGGGGLIILTALYQGGGLVAADGADGQYTSYYGYGTPGGGGSFIVAGYVNPGTGNGGNGCGPWAYCLYGASGGNTTYTLTQLSDLVNQIKRAAVDYFLVTVLRKTPSKTTPFPNFYGSGGGGQGTGGTVGSGWGGGGGGGQIVIIALQFNNGGTIRANGGSSTGGATGGGGGLVYIIYGKLTSVGTIQATGYNGGTTYIIQIPVGS